MGIVLIVQLVQRAIYKVSNNGNGKHVSVDPRETRKHVELRGVEKDLS